MVIRSDRAETAAKKLSEGVILGFILAFLLGLGLSAAVLPHAPSARVPWARRCGGSAKGTWRCGWRRADRTRSPSWLGISIPWPTGSANTAKSSLGDLLQAQLQMQAALDSIPDPILVLGSGGDIQNVNVAAKETLEVDAGGSVGEPVAVRPFGRQGGGGRNSTATCSAAKRSYTPRGSRSPSGCRCPEGIVSSSRARRPSTARPEPSRRPASSCRTSRGCAASRNCGTTSWRRWARVPHAPDFPPHGDSPLSRSRGSER